MNRRLSLTAALPLLLAVATAIFALSLASGSLPLTPGEIVQSFGAQQPSIARDVVLELRLPRALPAPLVASTLNLPDGLLSTGCPGAQKPSLNHCVAAILTVSDLT